jgi:hypothetical protein
MMNIMVTGLLCAHRLGEMDQVLLSSTLRPSAATPLGELERQGGARLFLFVWNLLYLLVFFTAVV